MPLDPASSHAYITYKDHHYCHDCLYLLMLFIPPVNDIGKVGVNAAVVCCCDVLLLLVMVLLSFQKAASAPWVTCHIKPWSQGSSSWAESGRP